MLMPLIDVRGERSRYDCVTARSGKGKVTLELAGREAQFALNSADDNFGYIMEARVLGSLLSAAGEPRSLLANNVVTTD